MSSIAHRNSKIGLVADLSWSVFSTSDEKVNRARTRVRKQAVVLGATRHTINQLGSASYLGLYTPPALSTNTPKRLHSLALAFIESIASKDKSAINAILVMSVHADDQRRALVIIEGGQVTHDRLEKVTDALQRVQEARASGVVHTVFCEVDELPSSNPVTWQLLEANCSKATELVSIPKNTALLLAGVILLIGAMTWGLYYKMVVQPAKERAEMLAKQAAENLTPQYLQLLNRELAKAAWRPEQVLTLLGQIDGRIAYFKGWALENLICDADAAKCTFRYARLGGITKELIEFAPDFQYDTLASSKDAAVMHLPLSIEHRPIGRDSLPEIEPAIIDLRSRFQHMTNAGANVNIAAPTKWPTQGVDIKRVDPKVIVSRAPVEVSFAYPYANQIIEDLPGHVGIRSFSVVIAHGQTKADSLKLTLKGHLYAK